MVEVQAGLRDRMREAEELRAQPPCSQHSPGLKRQRKKVSRKEKAGGGILVEGTHARVRATAEDVSQCRKGQVRNAPASSSNPLGSQGTEKPRRCSSRKVRLLGLKLSKEGLRWDVREQVNAE